MNPEGMEIHGSDHEENVSVKLEKEEDDYCTTKRKIIFEREADVSLEFKNEKPIYINRMALALRSKYFFYVFFGSLPREEIQIQDFDRETFQTFLNCLFRLKEYSVSDALMIYPIAYKYEAEECLEKCVSVLKPTELNEDVCKTLNLALLYECEELVDNIIRFFNLNVGIFTVLENKNYCSLLQPRAMSELVKHVSFDSDVWKIIYEWGKDYLEDRMIITDIHTFFTEIDILKKLSLYHFESVQSILDFHKLTNKQLLDSDEIVEYIRNNLTRSSGIKLPEKSCLVTVKGGEKIKETIVFKNSILVSCEDSEKCPTLTIWRNRRRRIKETSGTWDIKCKPRLKFRRVFSEGSTTERETSVANKRFRANHNITGSVRALSSTDDQSSSFDSIQKICPQYFGGPVNSLSFPINLPYKFAEIISVEITYTFSDDGRILKSLIGENFIHDDDEMYFTKDVVYSQ